MANDAASLIKSAIPISQYVARFTDTIKSVGRGKFKANCVAHGGDNKTAMSIDDNLNIWYCHSSDCNGGSIIDLWMRMNDSKDFVEAIKALSVELNVELPEYENERSVSIKRIMRAIKLVAEEAHDFLKNDDHPDAKQARRYIRSRKIKVGIVDEWGIGMLPSGREAVDLILEVCDDEDALIEAGILSRNKRGGLWASMNGRLHFPIRDESGATVAFGSRIVPEVDHSMEGKFVNTHETSVYHKSRILYGIDRIKKDTNRIIVVEGYLDTIAMNRVLAGSDAVAVAVCGTSLAEGHVDILNRFKSVTYVFDGDDAGKKAAIKSLWSVNKLNDKASVVTLESGQDPWDLYSAGREDELKSVIRNSLPICTMVVQSKWELIDHSEMDLIEWVRQTVTGLNYSHHRDQIISDSALIVGKSVASIKRELAVPVDINTRRTGSAAIDMMSAPTKSLCKLLLSMDEDTRGGILASFIPWTSKVEEAIKRWLPVNTEMDLAIIKKIVLGAKDTTCEGRVELAVADMMSDLSQNDLDCDASVMLRGIAKQMLSELAAMKSKSTSPTLSTQIKLTRRAINASREVQHQHTVFAFLVDMSIDIERQNRALAREVA